MRIRISGLVNAARQPEAAHRQERKRERESLKKRGGLSPSMIGVYDWRV